MTPARIAEIRKRCEAATPGPWADMNGTVFAGEIHACRTFVHIADMPKFDDRPDDFAFIAHARTDLPDALNAIEERDRRIAELEAQNAMCANFAAGIQQAWESPDGDESAARIALLAAPALERASEWLARRDGQLADRRIAELERQLTEALNLATIMRWLVTPFRIGDDGPDSDWVRWVRAKDRLDAINAARAGKERV